MNQNSITTIALLHELNPLQITCYISPKQNSSHKTGFCFRRKLVDFPQSTE